MREVRLNISDELYDSLTRIAQLYGQTVEEFILNILKFSEMKPEERVSELERDSLVRLMLRKNGEIAALRFRSHELYEDNKALILRLSGCESLVEAYRKRNRETGATQTKDGTTERLFRRYFE